MINVCEALAPTSILDAGCGEGFIFHPLVQRFPDIRLVGLDIDYFALNRARALDPDMTCICGRIENLGFADNAFNVVVCAEVLEHVADPHLALRELCRVAAKHVVLSVPNEPYFWISNLLGMNHLKTFGNFPGHRHHWSTKAFIKMVSGHIYIHRIYRPFPWTLIAGSL